MNMHEFYSQKLKRICQQAIAQTYRPFRTGKIRETWGIYKGTLPESTLIKKVFNFPTYESAKRFLDKHFKTKEEDGVVTYYEVYNETEKIDPLKNQKQIIKDES